jgi:hypothetical protein
MIQPGEPSVAWPGPGSLKFEVNGFGPDARGGIGAGLPAAGQVNHPGSGAWPVILLLALASKIRIESRRGRWCARSSSGATACAIRLLDMPAAGGNAEERTCWCRRRRAARHTPENR